MQEVNDRVFTQTQNISKLIQRNFENFGEQLLICLSRYVGMMTRGK